MSNNLKQVELAKETMKVFQDHGEDLSEVRHVIHYFYDGNFRGLGESLRELGYEVRMTVDEDGVVAERHDAIDEQWRTQTLPVLCDLADTYGVEYDDWEASMERQSKAQQSNAPSKPGLLSKISGKKN